jgi:hypothetical protein
MADTKSTETKTGATVKTAAPATPAKTPAPEGFSERSKKIMNITSIGSSVGLLAGLGYAFSKKKGFWGYVGFSILGSIAFGTAAGVGAQILVKKEDK